MLLKEFGLVEQGVHEQVAVVGRFVHVVVGFVGEVREIWHRGPLQLCEVFGEVGCSWVGLWWWWAIHVGLQGEWAWVVGGRVGWVCFSHARDG